MLASVLAAALAVADAGSVALEPPMLQRSEHAAALQGDGRVLVCGGFPVSTSCEHYLPVRGTWGPGPSMVEPHAIVPMGLLSDGKTLLVDYTFPIEEVLTDGAWSGGDGGPGVDRAPLLLAPSGDAVVVGGTGGGAPSERIFVRETATGGWRRVADLPSGVSQHTVSRLASGALVVVGGDNGAGATDTVYRAPGGDFGALTTSKLLRRRAEHCATALYDGSLLVCGGGDASCEQSLDEGRTWREAAPLPEVRYDFEAALLPDGRLLVLAGKDALGNFLESTALFDPGSRTWSPGPALAQPRRYATATLLPTGRVLLAGGVSSTAPTPPELLDGFRPSVSAGPALPVAPERWLRAAMLPSGRTWLTGLSFQHAGTLLLAPGGAGGWVQGPSLPAPRLGHSLTQLRSGRVLVAGGGQPRAVLFDEGRSAFQSAGMLLRPRAGHQALLLASGKVLVVGGVGEDGRLLRATELYDEDSQSWSPGPELPVALEGMTLTLLYDGSVLLVGGQGASGLVSDALRWREASPSWERLAPMGSPRAFHSATLLPTGQVWIAGGKGAFSTHATAQRFDPSTASWSPEQPLRQARARHAASLLPSGFVLLAGGVSTQVGGELSSTELFDPLADRGVEGPALSRTRGAPVLASLFDGRLLALSSESPQVDLFDEGRGTGPWAPALSADVQVAAPGGQARISGERFRGLSRGTCDNWRASPTDYPLFLAVRADGAQFSLTTERFTETEALVRLPPSLPVGTYRLVASVNGVLSPGRSLAVGVDIAPGPTDFALHAELGGCACGTAGGEWWVGLPLLPLLRRRRLRWKA